MRAGRCFCVISDSLMPLQSARIDGRDAELQAFFTASDRYRLENSSRCGVKSFIIFFPLFQMLVRLKSLLREGGSPKPQYEDYVWL